MWAKKEIPKLQCKYFLYSEGCSDKTLNKTRKNAIFITKNKIWQ